MLFRSGKLPGRPVTIPLTHKGAFLILPLRKSKTLSNEGTSQSSGMRLGMDFGGVSGKLGDKSKTTAGKAIRGCVVEIAEYLALLSKRRTAAA